MTAVEKVAKAIEEGATVVNGKVNNAYDVAGVVIDVIYQEAMATLKMKEEDMVDTEVDTEVEAMIEVGVEDANQV